MTVRIVRLGGPRLPGEGLRIGTVRHPPRGVPKSEHSTRNWYDVWFPELAPSAQAVKLAQAAVSERHWNAFVKRYRAEMAAPEKARMLALLAALSRHSDFSVGCYCADESRCHRSVLRALLEERGGRLESAGERAPGLRLGFVALSVTDLGRSLRFYRDAIGLPLREADHDAELDDPWYGGEHAAYSWTDGAFIHFALYPKRKPMRPVATGAQIGFHVSDFDAAHARVLASGAQVVSEPRAEPWGRTARYLDPDGNIVSITESSRGMR